MEDAAICPSKALACMLVIAFRSLVMLCLPSRSGHMLVRCILLARRAQHSLMGSVEVAWMHALSLCLRRSHHGLLPHMHGKPISWGEPICAICKCAPPILSGMPGATQHVLLAASACRPVSSPPYAGMVCPLLHWTPSLPCFQQGCVYPSTSCCPVQLAVLGAASLLLR